MNSELLNRSEKQTDCALSIASRGIELAQHLLEERIALVRALRAAYSVLMDGTPDSECDIHKREAREMVRTALAKAVKEPQ